jgi:peptide deformylase
MAVLPLTYAPNPIFKQRCDTIDTVDSSIQKIADDMLATLACEKAVGIGANMVGILKRIAVVDLCENDISNPYVFINPEITWKSEETQTFEEASLSFPGISASITRPKEIELSYLDYEGNPQTLKASDFLATVIQHEVDYLDGVVYLDYLSKLKRDRLINKMLKHLKQNHPQNAKKSCECC